MRRHARLAGALWIVARLAVPPAAAAQDGPAEARLEAARDFGYLTGDLLELRAAVRAPRGFEPDVRALQGGEWPAWLELREATVEADAAGDAVDHRFRFVYQLFFVPDSVTRLEIPAREIVLRSAQGDEAARAIVPAFAFMMSPLTGAAAALEPDWPVPPPSLRGLGWAAGSLLWLLVAWGAWEAVERMRRRRRIFWRADREIRREPDCGRAMLVLHRALEARAGRALFGHDLDVFVERWPAASSVREELARFFDLSEGLFFGDHGTRVPDDCLPWLRQLAARLRELERRHGPGRRVGR